MASRKPKINLANQFFEEAERLAMARSMFDRERRMWVISVLMMDLGSEDAPAKDLLACLPEVG